MFKSGYCSFADQVKKTFDFNGKLYISVGFCRGFVVRSKPDLKTLNFAVRNSVNQDMNGNKRSKSQSLVS